MQLRLFIITANKNLHYTLDLHEFKKRGRGSRLVKCLSRAIFCRILKKKKHQKTDTEHMG